MPIDNPSPHDGTYTVVGQLLRNAGEEAMAASLADTLLGDKARASLYRQRSSVALAQAEILDPAHTDAGWK